MAKRTDANQKAIVSALRKMGCSVTSLHAVGHGCPDLLVGFRGRNVLLEVKSAKGSTTPDQIEWGAAWRGQLDIVRTLEDAISVVTR